MLFQLQQQLEDSKPGSRNWEGDDNIYDSETTPAYPKVTITWKPGKEVLPAVGDRNIILFGVRGAGSCYIHANFRDSAIIGAATIANVTGARETAAALEKDVLEEVSPSAPVCLLCHNARLSCWTVCCQAKVPHEAARFLVESVIDTLSAGQKEAVEVHCFDSMSAALYRTPSRERAVPPLLRVVAAGMGVPEGCSGLETPNLVEGVGAAVVNYAHFSEGGCKAAVYVTLVEAAFVEERALMEFDGVVKRIFGEDKELMLVDGNEIKKVLRKITWSSPKHLFA